MAEVVLALDVADAAAARRTLDRIPRVRWVKVGSILMTREGGSFVAELVARGLKVFLDLKWHDIPSTVAGAVAVARGLGVSMATVHTLGGGQMMRAATEAAGNDLGLVGVTVLTSHDAASFGDVVDRPADLAQEVRRLARSARAARLRGVVCSPVEAALVRAELGNGAWIVVPGIRRPSDPVDDQARTATPSEAVRAGATHLVVGRPILTANDPAGAFAELMEVAAG